MKKRIIIATLVILCVCAIGFSACAPMQSPTNLTVADCFKEFVAFQKYKASSNLQGYEEVAVRGDNQSLLLMQKNESVAIKDKYSFFLIYTTKKASEIRVNELSFDVVADTNCNMQFALGLSSEDTRYSSTLSVMANKPTEVIFYSLSKTWTKNDAGASELKTQESNGVSERFEYMTGDSNTYIAIRLQNKRELTEVNYTIQNLKIVFERL